MLFSPGIRGGGLPFRKVETENIGIEKIVKNILSNKAIRFLICCGNEPPKHLTGATWLALFTNGIDSNKNIIGSPGMRPNLPNTSPEEVDEFRQRITPVDLIGETDPAVIAEIANRAGLDPVATEDQSIKDELKANTTEAVERGVFGAPTFFVGDEMFFGNDRFEFIEEAAS